MAEKPAETDRRRGTRVPTSVKAEFRCRGATGTAMTVDLSRDGLFLHTTRSAPVGSSIHLRFFLLDQREPIRILGTVARVVRPGTGALPGLGVRFEAAYAQERETLEAFVAENLAKIGVAPAPSVEHLPGGDRPSFYAVERAAPGMKEPRPPLPRTADEVRERFGFHVEVAWRDVWSIVWKVAIVGGGLLTIVCYCWRAVGQM